MKSVYRFMHEAWKRPKEGLGELWKEHLMQWRREPQTHRIEHPTRIDRARSLGYKAKSGFIIARQRVGRGSHRRPRPEGGRRTAHSYETMALRKNWQLIAEERAQVEFVNLAVLNSYWVGEDGRHQWYEVILVDPAHPAIKADPHLKWIAQQKHRSRVFHGKTSAGKRVRGMLWKGKGAEKMRPSRRANLRKG